jgi:hypothetical protein
VLERGDAGEHLLACLAAGQQRHQDLADAVAGEAGADAQPGPGAGHRLGQDLDRRPDRRRLSLAHHPLLIRRPGSLGIPGQRPPPVGVELIPQRRQRHQVQPADPARPRRRVLHQAGVLEDLQMLRHRRPAHRQPRRQPPHSPRPLGQARHDSPARAVSQRTPPVTTSVSNH